MTAIRLVVSDVDGTLVDKQKQVTEATVAAVAELRAAGVGFTVISARPRSGMMPILDRLAIDGDVAAFNGGTIFRRDGGVSYHVSIDAETARGILTLAEGKDVGVWLFADDIWYASDLDGPHTASERITANQEPTALADAGDAVTRADKITFVCDDEPKLRALADKAKARFGDRATIAQSQAYYLDATAPGADKGAGITALAAAHGVSLADTAAIGDQANDIPMLKVAGLPIAVANAPDAVKALARHVTTANDADGVANAIRTLILPKVGASV